MKNVLFTFTLLLLLITGFSRVPAFEYNGRLTRTVKVERLNNAFIISDLVPEFWQNLGLPYQVRQDFDLRKKVDYDQRFSSTPQFFDYRKIVEIVWAEITTTNNGQLMITQNTGDLLTKEQKQQLNSADLGSEIYVNVKVKYKAEANNTPNNSGNIIYGVLVAVVVPETEAEYVGGFKQLSAYFIENVFNQVAEPTDAEKIANAAVKFTVNEQGQVVGAKIARSTNDPKLDKLLLEATYKMPKWKPALDSKGMRVKQEFSIPFGNEGC